MSYIRYAHALSFADTVTVIKTIGHLRSVIVLGENGVGKTALFHHLKALPEFANHIAVDPIDCTQLSDGSFFIPDVDRELGVSRELPNERLGLSKLNHRGVPGAKPVLAFLDEIAKAKQYIKEIVAPYFYERRLGIYHAPVGSVIFGASNLDVEGLGDSFQQHLMTRIIPIILRKPNAEELIVYATAQNWHPAVIAFLTFFPKLMDSFMDYMPGGKYERRDLDKDNEFIFNPALGTAAPCCNPRTMNAASDVLHAGLGVLPDFALFAALCGAIGETGAYALMTFVKLSASITDYGRVIRDPLGAPLSDNATAQLMQAYQFVSRVSNRDEAAACTQYVTRMQEEMQNVFCHSVASGGAAKVALFSTILDYNEMNKRQLVYGSN